jgi:hypothetical protein
MFNRSDEAKLADLVQRAANNPMDLRDLADPGKVQAFANMMKSLSVDIGPLVIALSHDRMPPDWRAYRHLSVSQSGRQPSEAIFLRIAAEVGMGDPSKWNADIVRSIEQRMPVRMNARHAFQPMMD